MANLAVDSVGAVTSIGRSAPETLRSLEADICGTRMSPYVSATGERFVVSPVVEVRPDLTGIDRAMLLARPALDECLRGLRLRGRVACVVGIDGAIPDDALAKTRVSEAGRSLRREYSLLGEAIHQLLIARGVPCVSTRAIPLGPHQGLLLKRAARWIEAGVVGHVLWMGVSSACEPQRLEFVEEFKLFTHPTRWYPIIGGEAAAVVALGSEGALGRRLTCASAKEPDWIDARPSRGEALTATLRAVSQGMRRGATKRVFLDIPDAPALIREWTLAQFRNAETLDDVNDVLRPAGNLGQVSATTLPLYTALACLSEADTALAIAMSEGSTRSAVRVDRL